MNNLAHCLTQFTHPPSRQLIATVLMLLALSALPESKAMAQPSCGDTVGPNGTVVLQGHIGLCDDDTGGLKVVGPVTLDLNGFQLVCFDSDQDKRLPIGIEIVGKKAVVRNGQVQGCATGVSVAGQGQHRVERIRALNNRHGFEVPGKQNTLIKNEARNNSMTGFSVAGSNNTLRANTVPYMYTAHFVAGPGFVIAGEDNKIIKNTAKKSYDAGFFIRGKQHFVDGNFADENAAGFVVDGESHTLSNNIAGDSLATGFRVQGNQMTLKDNAARYNAGQGFLVDNAAWPELAGESLLQQNVAEYNGQSGIVVGQYAGGNNRLLENTALNNNLRGAATAFDLADFNANCGTNQWQQNIYGSSNQPCVQ